PESTLKIFLNAQHQMVDTVVETALRPRYLRKRYRKRPYRPAHEQDGTKDTDGRPERTRRGPSRKTPPAPKEERSATNAGTSTTPNPPSSPVIASASNALAGPSTPKNNPAPPYDKETIPTGAIQPSFDAVTDSLMKELDEMCNLP